MYIDNVPFVPNTTVIKKKIVYSDYKLKPIDFGFNPHLTTISSITDTSLEDCIKTILESNPSVVFEVIQYSMTKKELYFYTNDDISLRIWESKKADVFNSINSDMMVLKELNNILKVKETRDSDSISLYDLGLLITKTNEDYEIIKKYYQKRIDYIVNTHFGSISDLIIDQFDYDKKELHLKFSYIGNDVYDEIILTKKNDILVISKSNSCWKKEILDTLKVELSTLYDQLIPFGNLKKEVINNKKDINEKFSIQITSYGVRIWVITGKINNFYFNIHDFSIFFHNHKCILESNSSFIIDSLKGKEEEIFRNIFIKISDCPDWAQDILYNVRQNQIIEEQKKGKRLELTKIIFPFLKK